MITLTEIQRKARPAKYLKKDARTRIYRALYGHALGHDPQGLPELNERRKLPERFNWNDAYDVFHSLVNTAEFSNKRHDELLQRLNQLRKFKSQEAETEH